MQAALQLLKSAKTRGRWLILQNCHFLINWMQELEQEINNKEKIHPDFRLFLTTKTLKKFPIGIVQQSFKNILIHYH